jgi:hypothetical protein
LMSCKLITLVNQDGAHFIDTPLQSLAQRKCSKKTYSSSSSASRNVRRCSGNARETFGVLLTCSMFKFVVASGVPGKVIVVVVSGVPGQLNYKLSHLDQSSKKIIEKGSYAFVELN